MKKNWLVFARREKCHHREALENLPFIDWTMEHNNFSIGDIVYIYPTNEDGIKFKTEVVAKNCERKDGDYWVDKNKIDSFNVKIQKELFEDLALVSGFFEVGIKSEKIDDYYWDVVLRTKIF